jgi:hypothetical protein
MDTVSPYREIIRRILLDYARIPYAYGQIQQQAVFDPVGDHYLLVNVGWDHEGRRVHGCLVHVDLIDGKFWIQRDGTEYGVACELEDAGVPKDHIVLAFREPAPRPHAGYAVA